MYGEYRPLFEGVGSGPGDSTLEDKLYEYEVGWYSLSRRLSGFVWANRNFLGQNKHQCLYDAVQFCFVLLLVEIERTRMSKYCLDSRMHCTET